MLERITEIKDRSWEWFSRRAHTKGALWWLLLITFLEPIISPIVPETLLVAILLAGSQRWKFYAAITAITSIAGGVAGYFIGAFLFELIGAWLVSIQGLEAVFTHAQTLMQQHVFVTMIIASFTPLPDKAFVLAGGFLGASFLPYILGYALGRTVRIFVVAYLTKRYGSAIIATINRYFMLFALVAVALFLIIVFRYFHFF
jgi:membrane protein YqaA with SNARE-associated domain